MTTWVGLLQGINVGGRRTLPMAAVRAVVEEAGGHDVRTYVQSGNVVFGHRSRSEAPLRTDLERRLGDHAGFVVPVVLRSAAQWRALVEGDPFPGVEPTRRFVACFAADVPDSAWDVIDVDACAPEELVVRGRDVYLHLPAGMGVARLPRVLAAMRPARGAPPRVVTTRNWRTVLRLAELVGG